LSMTTFAQLGLSPARLTTLEALGFEMPTPIQAKAIPIALAGTDVIGCAQTGTGKTAAFVLPLLERLKPREQHAALILAPTRELALQIHSELQRLAGAKEPLSVVLIGGVPLGPQISQVRRGLPVIIATPGRLVDHLQQRHVKLSTVHTLVLDEADRMLDMGFAPQLERVLSMLPRQRHSMLFSATLSNEVTRFAQRHMQAPVSVGVAPSGTTASKITQRVIGMKDDLKLPLLAKMVTEERGKVLVFVRTRGRADKFAKKLGRLGENVGQLHSDRSQGQRKTALDAFRSGAGRVLVATDLAARGIDVTDIALVVNADVPRNPEDYVHRIGRTARAETTGTAVTFVGGEERSLWIPIERLIRQRLPMERVDETDPVLKSMIAKFAVADHFKPQHRPHQSQGGGEQRSPSGQKFGTRSFSSRGRR
jgi:ATP-dependent RNA helicase RhlE